MNLKLSVILLALSVMLNRERPITNTSGYKGVTWDKKNKKWYAAIKKDQKSYYIGRFVNVIDAAKAYNKKAIEFFGDFARINEI